MENDVPSEPPEDNDDDGEFLGHRFIVSKQTPEGPVDYVYLWIAHGQAFNSFGEKIDSKGAALVFLDYIRASFDEEASVLKTITFGDHFKFDKDGTMHVAKEFDKGNDTEFEIMGVYEEARRKLDMLVQVMKYRETIENMGDRIEELERKLSGEGEFTGGGEDEEAGS